MSTPTYSKNLGKAESMHKQTSATVDARFLFPGPISILGLVRMLFLPMPSAFGQEACQD
jgi:hypothetical protein